MLHLTGEERAKKEWAGEGFCLPLNVRSFVWQTHGICVYRAPLRADGVKHTVCGESLYADDFSTWDGEPCCFATPAHRITGNHEEKQSGMGLSLVRAPTGCNASLYGDAKSLPLRSLFDGNGASIATGAVPSWPGRFFLLKERLRQARNVHMSLRLRRHTW